MGKKATPADTAPATKPKAEAKPKPAEPKAKADPAPAKAKAAATPAAPAAKGAAAPAKAGVPKGGAKAGAAPAPAGKAKAKAVPKAVEPPPVEEPEDDGDFEVKKKKNRRGGQKKKEAEDGPDAEEVGTVGMPDEAHLAKVASKAAESLAEQDEDLLALRAKIKAAEEAEKGKAGAGNLASVNDEIEKMIAKKKAEMPKKAQPSHKCQMQIEELKVLMKQGQDIGSMLSEMEGKFVEAKKAECAKAVCTKLSYLQERVKKSIDATKTTKSIYAAAPAAPAAAAAADGGAPAGMSAATEERLEKRLKEKAATKGADADAAMVKETLELSPEIMKYLFNMPECFKLRFEKESMVLIDPIRGPKGAGKGKNVTPKELVVAGLSQEEVDKVVGALKALDFSGTQTREVNGSVMSRYEKVKEIESDFKVMAYKNRTQLTLYGSKANVPKAFEAIAKAEAQKAEENKIFVVDVDLTADNLKVMKAGPGGLRNVLAVWKGDAETVRMKIPEFGEEDDGKPKKLRLSGKTQAETDAVKKRVEDYLKSMASEFVEGDVSKVNGKGSNEAIRMAFKAIRDASAVRIDRKGDEGFQLMGPKKEIPAIKAKLQDLFKKANFEPAKITITQEQRRVFNEEKMQEISKKSGADVRRNNLNLVVVGDDAQVEKAKKEIDAVIEKEGTVDSIAVTDETMKALTMSRAAKLKDFQAKANTIISADPKTGTVSIVGSAKGVESTKKDLEKFAAQIEKDQADTIAKEITVAMEAIPRIIGTGGSVLKNIRETTGVSVRVGRDDGTVEIKGVESAVATAEKMIMDIVNGTATKEESPAKSKAAAKPARKKAEEYKGAATDFPTLGGEVVDEAATTAAATWGSGGSSWTKAMKKEEAISSVNAAESFPTLGGSKAPAKSAPAPTPAPAPAAAPKEEEKPAAPAPVEAEEEEEACDIDDPFAMMGGMGEETVYKVTLLEEQEEAADEEEAAAAAPAPAAAKPEAPKPAAAQAQEPPKVQPAAVPAAVTADEGFKGAEDDFPSLGAAPAGRRGKGR